MRTARGSAAAALAVAAALASTAGAPAPRHHPSPTRLHVAPWGDDHGPGTLDRPFATPARAQRAVRAIAPRMTSEHSARHDVFHLRQMTIAEHFVPELRHEGPYPGAWPPAPDCGDPQHLHFTSNTLLTPTAPCPAHPACTTITATAGPRPPYRRGLGLGPR
ncbi:hypothetical protein [Streptomyces sp. NPDC001833]|uniref:hypothetical protein n=1 Tax=Streptomyces sp. NPDC001833 TaxID=3154658 RepID=UPI00332FE36B